MLKRLSRRVRRHVDKYTVLACVGVLVYIVLVTLIASGIEVDLIMSAHDHLLAQQEGDGEGGGDGIPATYPAPPQTLFTEEEPKEWSPARMCQQAMRFADRALGAALTVMQSTESPAITQLHTLDLRALLSSSLSRRRGFSLADLSQALDRLLVPRSPSQSDADITAAGVENIADTVEAVEGLATVLRLRGEDGLAAECRVRLGALAGSATASLRHWEPFHSGLTMGDRLSGVWVRALVLRQLPLATQAAMPATRDLLAALVPSLKKSAWPQNRSLYQPGAYRMPHEGLVSSRLRWRGKGSHGDLSTEVYQLAGLASVAEGDHRVYEVLLNTWLLSKRTDTAAVVAYDVGVEGMLLYLLRTTHVDTTAGSPHYTNYTFAGYLGDRFFPVMHPLTCAMPAVLARGVRAGAHRYPSRSPERWLTEDNVLTAAEAMAATCFRLFGDRSAGHLRHPVYFTRHSQIGDVYARPVPVAHTTPSTENDDDAAAAAAEEARPSASPGEQSDGTCAMPSLLLRSFYELYETTHDPMYGRWALQVMRRDADHCSVRRDDLRQEPAWMRYLGELRFFVYLFHSMECLTQQPAEVRRQRWCQLAQHTVLSSSASGHLVLVE